MRRLCVFLRPRTNFCRDRTSKRTPREGAGGGSSEVAREWARTNCVEKAPPPAPPARGGGSRSRCGAPLPLLHQGVDVLLRQRALGEEFGAAFGKKGARERVSVAEGG